MISVATALFGGLIDLAKDWRQDRSEKRKEEHAIRKAKVKAKLDRIEAGDAHAAGLDEISLRDRGYKDDLLLYLIITPCVLAFFPSTVPWVQAGFRTLNSLPEWYLLGLLLVFVDTFGFRRLLRTALEAYVKRKFG